MLKDTAQLFDALVHFVTQQGYGEVYTRDPRQEVPPDCGFVRFRTPGGVLFTSAGLVKFCTREEGVMACKAFAEQSRTPMEVQMNFPRASPHTFASPTFATAQAATESRWLRWKRAWGAWRH
jgi:hypothetical protein